MELYTVGYEGWEIEDFVKFLKSKKIHIIADLRKNPISRKKGFSKHKLAAQLLTKKIGYMHFPNLGVPSVWRKNAKEGFITREAMFKKYNEEILPCCKLELLSIKEKAKKQNVALLCYEAEASDCHRHFVAKKLKKTFKEKIKITDLVRL